MSDNISKYVAAISNKSNFDKVNEEKNKYDQEFANNHISNTLADMDINSHAENGVVRVYPQHVNKAKRVLSKLGYTHKVVGSLKEDLDDLSEDIRKSLLDQHISDFSNKIPSSVPFHGRYHYNGKLIPHQKNVTTSASNDEIFKHLKSMGYNKTKGYDPKPDGFNFNTDHENMRSTSDSLHHKSKVVVHISKEHGSPTTVHFTDYNKINESLDLDEGFKYDVDHMVGNLGYRPISGQLETKKDNVYATYGTLERAHSVANKYGFIVKKHSYIDPYDKKTKFEYHVIKESDDLIEGGHKMFSNHNGSYYIEDGEGNAVLRNLSKGEAEHEMWKRNNPEEWAKIQKTNKPKRIIKSLKESDDDNVINKNHPYGVYFKGGSIGDKPDTENWSRHGKLRSTHETSEEAKEVAKRMNSYLSPGEKKYYGMKYHVKPLKRDIKESDDKDVYGNPISAREKLYRNHQNIRKKAGLPDPNYYLELAKKKKQELEQMQDKVNK